MYLCIRFSWLLYWYILLILIEFLIISSLQTVSILFCTSSKPVLNWFSGIFTSVPTFAFFPNFLTMAFGALFCLKARGPLLFFLFHSRCSFHSIKRILEQNSSQQKSLIINYSAFTQLNRFISPLVNPISAA